MYYLLIPVIFILVICVCVQSKRSYDFQVTRLDFFLNNLPGQFESIKAIHLSDLHISKSGPVEEKIITTCNKEKPDIIFITGDFVSNSSGIDPCLKTIKELKAPLGIWAVWGNNDNYLKTDRLKKGLKNLGINVLVNENCLVKRKEDKIRLIGVDDPYKRKDDLEKALIDVEDTETKILLAHSPEIFPKSWKYKIDLVLAGHTHGGQVRFPLVGTVYNHTWSLIKYSGGYFKQDSSQMYVSRGLGMSLLPIRFLCPAEITVITLKRNASMRDA